MKLRVLLCLLIFSISVCARENLPCIGTTTTNLNVRTGPSKQYTKKDLLPAGKQVVVLERANSKWVLIEYDFRRGYVHSSYLRLSPMPQQPTVAEVESSDDGIMNWVWKILQIAIAAVMVYISIVIFFNIWTGIMRLCLRLIKNISTIFYVSNWLQRFLHKPWYIFLKDNNFSNETNKILRATTYILKIPLYLLFTPLRFINATFYNLFIHCAFEMLNYTYEVVDPTSISEGRLHKSALHLMLWRILKYPVWHGSLVIIESIIWTVIDTIFPALTLYHGTCATHNIVSSPTRFGSNRYNVGLWLVGGGNFAGNGIYFASSIRTAEHYACFGDIIVCRVTLGRTLDLGLAPRYVFNQCGHPNATDATRWGLNNGYVTGEWWRPDNHWWEFCMYDWQNRYNESWRIRPLYILGSRERDVRRIEGGMHHWLFRSIVIKDIFTSILSTIERILSL